MTFCRKVVILSVFAILLAGLGMGLFMSISVGPTIFAILRYSVNSGWKAGISFIIGVSLSDILYVVIANFMTDWLAALMQHLQLIGYIGALLFIAMGLHGYFKKIKVTRNKNDDAIIKGKDYTKIFASGFLMNTLNPGVIITWLTAVAAISTMTSSGRFVFFCSCLSLILSIDLLKVLTAQKLRKKLTPRNIVYLNRISALCILGLGLFLLIKTMLGIKIGSF